MLRRHWLAVALVSTLHAATASLSLADTVTPRVAIVHATKFRGGGLHEHVAEAAVLGDLLQRAGLAPVVLDQAQARAAGALKDCRTVLLLGDDGEAHLLADKALRQRVAEHVRRGGGLVLIHASTSLPEDLQAALLPWTGGTSHREGQVPAVNWPVSYGPLVEHPVTQGLTSLTSDDRWLPARKWFEGKNAPVKILTAIPPESARVEGKPDEVTNAWAFERADGGRTFAYTGGHFFEAWQGEELRRLIGNAVFWSAHLDVPAGGVSPMVDRQLLVLPKPEPSAARGPDREEPPGRR
jgi:Trehalose utilisation